MAEHLISAKSLLLSAIGGLLLSGCGDTPPDMPPGDDHKNDPPVTAQTNYYSDIKPLMERYCTSCHTQGEIAPFALTDYDSVKNHAALITPAVTNDKMPPWLPADDGLAMHYSRKLRPEDKKLLLDWIAAGAPAGDPASMPRGSFPPVETVTAPRADMTLALKNPYRPKTSGGDDYRCFVFDPALDRDRYLTAGLVSPDNRSIVHHVVVYLIPAAQAATAKALDSGNGYTCFGDAGVQNATPSILVAWAPGAPAMRTPDGTAFKLPLGSVMVLQMHYNTISDNGKPDQTGVVLELTDTPPQHELFNMFIAQTNLMIKANDAASHAEITAQTSQLTKRLGIPSGNLTVYGAFPHMHLLGRHIGISVMGGPLALDIPAWDFHWQGTYMYQNPFTLKPTDMLHLECDYDNSAANQPVIDGTQQTPKDVRWGENTLDEMCVGLLLVSGQ